MNPVVPHPTGGKRKQAAISPAPALRLQVSLPPGAHDVSRVEVHAIEARRACSHFKFKSLNVHVPYLKYSRKGPDGKTRSYFMLFYHQNGQRRRETRSTFAKAEARAEQIAKIISTGQTNLLSYRQADHARYLGLQELAHKIGISPEAGLATLENLIKRAGSIEALQEDARWGFENRPRGAISRNVPEVVQLMLDEMARGDAGERWIADLRSRLTPNPEKWTQTVKPFTQHFSGPVHELRAEAIAAWLDALKVAPRTRNNYRCAILALVAYARDKKYLPRNWNEMADVRTVRVKRKVVRIYTPEQITALLLAARPNLEPFIAIQAFAGIRTREIQGDAQHPALDWSNINLQEREIRVPGDVAKEGTPERIVPISDNLAAWLATRAKRNGPVVTLSNLTNALRNTARRAKVPFIHNGLRKTFISGRLAVVKDIGRVAEEAGNSPSIIKTNYRQAITESEGKRIFEIRPWPTAEEAPDLLQLDFKIA